ncbi:hypothetical protein NOGI109294_13245 [Nocardiopsis gilva]
MSAAPNAGAPHHGSRACCGGGARLCVMTSTVGESRSRTSSAEVASQFDPRGQVELPEDVPQVVVDRVRRAGDQPGHLRVGLALRHQERDPEFRLGEPVRLHLACVRRARPRSRGSDVPGFALRGARPPVRPLRRARTPRRRARGGPGSRRRCGPPRRGGVRWTGPRGAPRAGRWRRKGAAAPTPPGSRPIPGGPKGSRRRSRAPATALYLHMRASSTALSWCRSVPDRRSVRCVECSTEVRTVRSSTGICPSSSNATRAGRKSGRWWSFSICVGSSAEGGPACCAFASRARLPTTCWHTSCRRFVHRTSRRPMARPPGCFTALPFFNEPCCEASSAFLAAELLV